MLMKRVGVGWEVGSLRKGDVPGTRRLWEKDEPEA